MKVSKIQLNNLRSILKRVGEIDLDIQNTLFDINERETEELHYQLMDIADRIEAEIEILEIDNPELALRDTVRNPAKALMGGPTEAEAVRVLKEQFGYTDKELDTLRN